MYIFDIFLQGERGERQDFRGIKPFTQAMSIKKMILLHLGNICVIILKHSYIKWVLFLNIVICDDNKNYCELFTAKIDKVIKSTFDFTANIICLYSLEDLSDYLKHETADIIFLDIMFDEVNSLDYAMTDLCENVSRTIFMTSFGNEAYNLFETGCAYYLIKGRFSDEQLVNAIRRVLINYKADEHDVTIIKQSSKGVSVNYIDIAYIEASNNSIIIHFCDGKEEKIYTTLKKFAKNVPIYFVQCHKSFLVNMHSVTSVSPYEFSVSSGDKIPIPQKKYKQMVARYEEFINALV